MGFGGRRASKAAVTDSVTVFLLDENVLRELHPKGDARVRAWRTTVTDADLRISVMTLFEKRRGAERLAKSDPARATKLIAAIDVLETSYGARLVPIDGPVVAEWARLLGTKDKNQRDRVLAATARVHGFVLVTRNIDDVRGCGVQVLNPFKTNPQVETV